MPVQNVTMSVPTLNTLRAKRSTIMALGEQYGASNIRVFGSVARGDATPESDVDLLVTFQVGTSLFQLSALWQDLESLLGYSVNVVSDRGISERFSQHIADDVVAL